jgi:hypothetical protein
VKIRAKQSQFGKSFKFEVPSVKQEKPMVESSNFILYTSHELPIVQTNPICRWRAGKTIAKASGLDDATPHGGQ